MKVEIHSFQSAVRLKPNPNEKTIMIRIADPDYPKERDAELMYREAFVDVLKVPFHDITDEQLTSILKDEPNAPYKAIDREQAKEILSFFIKYQNSDRFIIQCTAGISRSSAVAIGFSRFLKNVELEKSIRESKRFIPNETVVSRLTDVIKELHS